MPRKARNNGILSFLVVVLFSGCAGSNVSVVATQPARQSVRIKATNAQIAAMATLYSRYNTTHFGIPEEQLKGRIRNCFDAPRESFVAPNGCAEFSYQQFQQIKIGAYNYLSVAGKN